MVTARFCTASVYRTGCTIGVSLSRSSLDSLVIVKNDVAATGSDAVKFNVPGSVRPSGSSVTKREKCWCAATVIVTNFDEFPVASV